MVEQRQQREMPPGFHNQKEGWVQTLPAPAVTGAGDQGATCGASVGRALGVGDAQGSLACCSPWGCKESDTTELLN